MVKKENHETPPFGRICLELFPSIQQANSSVYCMCPCNKHFEHHDLSEGRPCPPLFVGTIFDRATNRANLSIP